MIAINLIPERIIEAKQARSRARKLLTILMMLVIAGAIFACGGYLVRCIGDVDEQKRLALSNDITLMQETLLKRQRDIKAEELRAKQRNSTQASKVRVSQQMMELVSFIPKHITLSSLRIGDRQMVLSGVASKRSDVGELVSALRSQGQAANVSIETLRDIALHRHTFQEFVIRVATTVSPETIIR